MNLFIFICQQTLIFLVPLLLVGLGDLFSERSGVLNIALEGIMVFGAFAGIMFIRSASAAMPSWLVLLIAILISILAGMLLSALHAFASIHLKAEQTISSTAIITFATAFCIFYARVMLGTEQVVFRNTFRIDAVPLLSKIPVLGPILFQKAYVTTYLGILVLIVTAFILKRTRFGLRLRSCGENPQAADSVGISVYKMRYARRPDLRRSGRSRRPRVHPADDHDLYRQRQRLWLPRHVRRRVRPVEAVGHRARRSVLRPDEGPLPRRIPLSRSCITSASRRPSSRCSPMWQR